jgi:predicted MFS family arabinose efflux permease
LQTNATQMSPQARGTALAIFSSALYVGQTIGVGLAAPVIDHYGAPPVFVIAAVALPLLGLWFARRLKGRA